MANHATIIPEKPAVFVTGDVHNMSLRSEHQHRAAPVTEVETAIRYAEIAAKYGVRVNLALTGRALIEETRTSMLLAAMTNVALGGHGWDSFCMRRSRAILRLLTGSLYGPRWLQALELKRTIRAFHRTIGRRPLFWRGHACFADEHSPGLYGRAAIGAVSDEVNRDGFIRPLGGELRSIPINTIPDHDIVIHGEISAEGHIRAQTAWAVQQLAFEGRVDALECLPGLHRDDRRRLLRIARFRRVIRAVYDVKVLHAGSYSIIDRRAMSIDEWVDYLIGAIPRSVQTAGFATIVAHPLCMYLADGFSAFERLCKYLGELDTAFLSGGR